MEEKIVHIDFATLESFMRDSLMAVGVAAAFFVTLTPFVLPVLLVLHVLLRQIRARCFACAPALLPPFSRVSFRKRFDRGRGRCCPCWSVLVRVGPCLPRLVSIGDLRARQRSCPTYPAHPAYPAYFLGCLRGAERRQPMKCAPLPDRSIVFAGSTAVDACLHFPRQPRV